MSKPLQTAIINVGDLLQYPKLTIPLYQRPYKWTTRNVIQLLDDIVHHQDRSAYRLGTIVIHEEGERYNIVDGQQRTITLLLIVRAILKKKKDDIKTPELKRLLNALEIDMINPEFQNDISIANIRANYREIERRVVTLDEPTIEFLLKQCEFVQFVLSDISEAFQFFDSQNARGRDLEPHDLLKAFHLREFSEDDEPHKLEVVKGWESMKTEALASLFGEFLFRVRAWSQGQSARYFGKNDVGYFKGISLHKIDYPSTQLLRIAHFYLDSYNQSYERKIDKQNAPYPFQLDQAILNGRRFFEMIAHYKEQLDRYQKEATNNEAWSGQAQEIFQTLGQYKGRNRIGDSYVRNLFDCAMLYYIDKFGMTELDRAAEKFFLWAYSLRLSYFAVRLASVDKYVVEQLNIFQLIKNAVTPQDVLMLPVRPVETIKSTKTEAIQNLFASLGYYDKS